MLFKLDISNFESVEADIRPSVSVLGLPFSTPTADSLRKGTKEWVPEFEIPDDKPIVAVFRLSFPASLHVVDVAARLFRAQRADIRLMKPTSVRIDIRHEAGAVAQCTVICVMSGDSRSGAGACIDCTDGHYTVRICC